MQPQGKLRFFCPRCRYKLSFLDGTIIKMVGRLHAENFSCKTMFYVPAKLGQNGCVVGEGVRVGEGAKVELECINAACKHNFTTTYNDELAEIDMTDDAGSTFRVVFNKVYGKHSTFVLDMQAKQVVQSFGEAQHTMFSDPDERQRNFFGS